MACLLWGGAAKVAEEGRQILSGLKHFQKAPTAEQRAIQWLLAQDNVIIRNNNWKNSSCHHSSYLTINDLERKYKKKILLFLPRSHSRPFPKNNTWLLSVAIAIIKCHRLAGLLTIGIYCPHFWRLDCQDQGANRFRVGEDPLPGTQKG
jgi:hypothetical protein